MSLLLDALKKAAKEKEQANTPSVSEESAAREQVPAENITPDEQASPELTLDVDDASDEVGQRDDEQTVVEETDDQAQELRLEQAEVRGSSSTVSDEALQMLVYKTNREHRRKQKVVWLSVTLTAVLILMIGGYYFYSEMVNDVEALERKHRIALQKVNAEVIKRKDPKLIAGLTNAPEAVVTAQAGVTTVAGAQQNNTASQAAPVDKRSGRVASPIQGDVQSSVEISSRTQQDPVAEFLETGWLAYNKGDYATSLDSYNRVLDREPNNRDALLGTAAIAVANGDTSVAIERYEYLLQLDPQDPVAAPALSSLGAQALDGLGESSLKGLLKRNSQAHQVSFALGNIKAAEQNWPQAQSYYFDAWSQDPSNADYAFNIAVSLDNLGKRQQAAEFYQRSLSLAAKSKHSFTTEAARSRLQQLGR